MNRLQLVQSLRAEAGIAGSGPVSTIAQTGELARLVNWIDQAYRDICDKNTDWDFLRGDFSFNCTIGQSVYPTSLIVNHANWKDDSFRCYYSTVNDEMWIKYVEWGLFRDTRLRGASRNATGRPFEFTENPAKSVVLWPTPDKAYTIDGEYWQKAPAMLLDTDVPVFDRFQDAIVFNALMRYAAYVESPSLYARSQKEYNRLIAKIESNWMPDIAIGGAMA